MPEISLFGWFHTGVAIIALIAGFYSLVRFKYILIEQTAGKVYLICTLLAAGSALAIFRHGGFGVAHGLAVLTLLALLVGTIAAKTQILRGLSPYVQALSYSATLLFHMIPAITDGLMRLPTDAPIVTDIKDPLLKGFYLTFLICYIAIVIWQFISIRKNNSA
ncbi:hypothetical protein [Thalassotalea atypica]|uniref:hypothetical protein n=1 Tax=Thalassotalea atypica TaxID=2054316 RepID=UPI002573C542|nr:hypothetical protein [Thalassotalea atypica]